MKYEQWKSELWAKEIYTNSVKIPLSKRLRALKDIDNCLSQRKKLLNNKGFELYYFLFTIKSTIFVYVIEQYDDGLLSYELSAYHPNDWLLMYEEYFTSMGIGECIEFLISLAKKYTINENKSHI